MGFDQEKKIRYFKSCDDDNSKRKEDHITAVFEQFKSDTASVITLRSNVLRFPIIRLAGSREGEPIAPPRLRLFARRPTQSLRQMGRALGVLRRLRDEVGGRNKLAKLLGFTGPHLGRVLRGEKPMTEELVEKACSDPPRRARRSRRFLMEPMQLLATTVAVAALRRRASRPAGDNRSRKAKGLGPLPLGAAAAFPILKRLGGGGTAYRSAPVQRHHPAKGVPY